MTIFEKLKQALNNKARKKIGNNTYARLTSDAIIVSLHGNDIIVATLDKTVYYDCGWQTSTTKNRLNKWMTDGWQVVQKKRCWYLCGKDNSLIPFTNGVSIY